MKTGGALAGQVVAGGPRAAGSERRAMETRPANGAGSARGGADSAAGSEAAKGGVAQATPLAHIGQCAKSCALRWCAGEVVPPETGGTRAEQRSPNPGHTGIAAEATSGSSNWNSSIARATALRVGTRIVELYLPAEPATP